MLSNVNVLCEDDLIKLSWEWADKEVESVRIYYKRNGTLKGDGSSFIQEEVLPVPHNKIGKASRPIGNEWGLYTFTLVPKMEGGSIGEKMKVRDVMLGKPVIIPWQFLPHDKTIRFLGLSGKLPKGIAFLEDGVCRYQLDYELTKDTILLFPNEVDADKIRICAKEPYNKAYRFYKGN